MARGGARRGDGPVVAPDHRLALGLALDAGDEPTSVFQPRARLGHLRPCGDGRGREARREVGGRGAAGHRLDGFLDRGIHRKERIRGRGADQRLDRLTAELIVAIREGLRHLHQQQETVHRFEPTRRDPQQLVLEWELSGRRLRDPGIHPIHVRDDCRASGIVRSEGGPLGRGRGGKPTRSRGAIELERPRACHLSECARRRALGHLHLKEPIPCMHPPQGTKRIELRGGEDVWHAMVVVLDRHPRAESGERMRFLGRQLRGACRGPDPMGRVEQGAERGKIPHREEPMHEPRRKGRTSDTDRHPPWYSHSITPDRRGSRRSIRGRCPAAGARAHARSPVRRGARRALSGARSSRGR